MTNVTEAMVERGAKALWKDGFTDESEFRWLRDVHKDAGREFGPSDDDRHVARVVLEAVLR